MYIYVCTQIRVYMYICVYAYVYICIDVYMYIRMCTYFLDFILQDITTYNVKIYISFVPLAACSFSCCCC